MLIKKRSLLCFSFVILIVLFTALSVSPVLAAPTINRIMGADRYKTAVAISQAGWPNGATTAILTTGENYPDALSAAPLAHKYKAPILLTQSSSLNDDTTAELKRLGVKKVYLVGGLGAISSNVESQLAKLSISTTRIAGQDRFDTSVQVAKLVGSSKGLFVTTGMDFPDAVSAAPIAAAQGMPILLVPPDSLPATTQNYLNSSKVKNLYVLNGSNELSASLISQLPNAQVITGNDPYERNINLINQFSDNLNFAKVYAATGSDYPDALAASALAAMNQAPLILLQKDTIPTAASNLLASKLVNEIDIIGGEAAISAQVEAGLQSTPAQISAVDNITDSVADKSKYKFPQTVTATLTDGSQVQVPVTWTLASVNTGQPANGANNTFNSSTVYNYTGAVNGYPNSVLLTLTINPSTSNVKFNPIKAEAVQGFSYTFPTTVTGTFSDNTMQEYPVTWNISSNTSLSKIGTYTFQGTVAGVSQKVNLTLNVVADQPIDIPDGYLAQAVRYQLTGLTYGNTLYLSDALKVTKLVAYSKYITNLSGLEYFQNLTDLELSYNSINDAGLAPLKKLPNLEVLALNNNDITNVSALSGLNHLNTLYLAGNQITNYNPLKSIYKNLVNRDFTIP